MHFKIFSLTFLLSVFMATDILAGAIKERAEIADGFKWKPEHIYTIIDEWQKDYDFVKGNLEQLAAFKGTFAGPKAANTARKLIEFNQLSEQIGIKFERLFTYVMYNFNTDMANPKWMGKMQILQALGVEYGQKLAWVNPELLQIPQAIMHKYIDENPELEPYRKSYDDLYLQQKHVLTEPEEAIIALSGNVTSVPSDVYDQMTDSDMRFGYILDEKGDSVEVNYSGWVSWRTCPDRRVREDYYKALWNGYNAYSTTFAALMNGQIKKDIYLTQARKYDNTLQRAMEGNFIPVEVYSNLVETTRKNVAPLHKYNEIRKRMLGVAEYKHWDYYVSLINAPEERYSWDQGVKMILEALKPLGEKYVNDIRIGLDPKNGWVDAYAHRAKTSGAYSSNTYGVHPYMLFNFDSEKGLTSDDISTIAHEVGHSMHSYYSEKKQAYPNKDYATFNAEVASTVNETIMSIKQLDDARAAYKKAESTEATAKTKDAKDKAKQAKESARLTLVYLLNKSLDDIRQTFYRQTKFATWEWEAHKMGEKGEPLTKESLSKLYYDLLMEFHGPACDYGDMAGISWMMIPHFYRGYYVYAYATSYAASVALANDIIAEYKGDGSKKGARDRYLAFLASGSSKHPVELLKDAGVDMTTPAPIESLIKYAQSLVDELNKLTK